jgi:hypothetical protein
MHGSPSVTEILREDFYGFPRHAPFRRGDTAGRVNRLTVNVVHSEPDSVFSVVVAGYTLMVHFAAVKGLVDVRHRGSNAEENRPASEKVKVQLTKPRQVHDRKSCTR